MAKTPKRRMIKDLNWGYLEFKKGDIVDVTMKNSGAFLVGAVLSASEPIEKEEEGKK